MSLPSALSVSSVLPALSHAMCAEDEAFFARLPDAVKADVELWQRVMKDVLAARHPLVACRRWACELSLPNFSYDTIERRYYQIRDGASWRIFVNGRKLRGELRAAPTVSFMTPSVIEEWHAVSLQNQRKYKPAYRALVNRYRAGGTVGDVSWREVWKNLYPAEPVPARVPPDMPLPPGWSYENFMRHKPRRRLERAARVGVRAAAEFAYQVHTTRVGMHVGEGYVFDDVWHDLFLNFAGQTVAIRPLELGGADVLSGYKLEPGFKPRRLRQDGSHAGLDETDMRLYLVHVLCNQGYHKGGCTLYVEHGTAAIRERVASLLKEYSRGAIRVQRSGIEGARQYAQLYSGEGKGNPRFKAALESLHNLIHNETAALPAQTGMDRRHAPESLYGLHSVNTKLLIAAYALTPARAALLRFPAMDWNAGLDAIREAYYNMNRREDHDLEGWAEAGFVKHQFRLGPLDRWRNRAELDRIPPDKRAVVEAFVSHPDYHRVVRMSPFDVWHAGQKDLVKLPLHCIFLVCGQDYGVRRPCPPTDQIAFEDRAVESGPMIYETRYVDIEGRERRLAEGAEYIWLVNPFNPIQLFVGETHGGYLGMCRRCDVPCKTDTAAIQREWGRAAKLEAQTAGEAIRVNRSLIRRRIDDALHNAAVLAGEAVAPEEILDEEETRRRLLAENGDFRDLAEAGAPAPRSTPGYAVSMSEMNEL